MKALLRFLEDILPRVIDDVVEHLGTIWDILGIFGPIVAVVGTAAIAVVALRFHVPLAKRLPAMRAAGEADASAQSTLTVVPRLRGLRRLFKPKNRPLSVQLDATGLRIERTKTLLAASWTDISRWSRDGLADWTIEMSGGRYSVQLLRAEGFTEGDLRRIDNRVAFHITALPEITLQARVRDLRFTVSTVWESTRKRLTRLSGRVQFGSPNDDVGTMRRSSAARQEETASRAETSTSAPEGEEGK